MIQRLLGVASIEWKLLWRSPALWATAALALIYTFAAVAWSETYLDFAVHIGSGVSGIFPIAFALTWLFAANRARSAGMEELTESSALTYTARTAGQTIGGLLAALTVVMIVFSIDLVWYRLSNQALPRGVIGDLWIAPLLALPPLLPWIAVSRVAARFLSLTASYFAVLAVWIVGVFFRPPLNRLTISYNPVEFDTSELVLFGPEGGRILLLHRLIVFLVGVLLAFVAVFPRRREGHGMIVSISALALCALMLGSAALPGAFHVELSYTQPVTAVDWADEASTNPRWTSLQTSDGTAQVSEAHLHLAKDILRTVRDISSFDGTPLPTSILALEAPVESLSQDQHILLVPENTLRNIASTKMLTRRLISLWVRMKTTGASSQSRSHYLDLVKHGARLYIEWRYVEALLGREYADAEASAWKLHLGRLQGGPDPENQPDIDQADGMPLIQDDLISLADWRGGRRSVSSVALEMFVALLERLPKASVQEVLRAYTLWAHDIPPSARKEELVDAFVIAVQREGADIS